MVVRIKLMLCLFNNLINVMITLLISRLRVSWAWQEFQRIKLLAEEESLTAVLAAINKVSKLHVTINCRWHNSIQD